MSTLAYMDVLAAPSDTPCRFQNRRLTANLMAAKLLKNKQPKPFRLPATNDFGIGKGFSETVASTSM